VPFFEIKQRWALFWSKFLKILLRFSTNQNFGGAFAPRRLYHLMYCNLIMGAILL